MQIVPIDEEKPTYISGEEGYIVSVEDNPLVQDNIEALAYSIGQQLNGFTFRPYSAESLSNPAAEAGDVALIVDRKGNRYQSIVSNLSFKISDFESFSGDTETPNKKEGSRYSASAKAVQAAKKETEKQISNYDLAVQQLSNLMANAMGIFETVQTQEDGSVICYAHDKPTLSESQTIWKKSRDAFAVSFDGGSTWHGMTADGNIIAKVLTAIGINADWINAGSVKAENISQEYKKDVTDEISSAANEVTQAFKAADGVLFSRISSKVSKDEISSTINQTAQEVLIDASKINLSGYATFSNLSTSGGTLINGDNIKTGKLNANLIQTGKIVNPSNPSVYFDLTKGILASSKLVGTSTTTENIYASIGTVNWAGGETSNGMLLVTGNTSFLNLADKDTGSAFQPIGADISSPGNMSIRSCGSANYPSSAQAQNALDLYKTDTGQGQLSLYRANGNSRDEVLRADEEMVQVWCRNGIIQFVTGEYARASIEDNGAYFGDLYTNGIKVTSDRARKTAIQSVQFEAIEKIKQLNFYSYQINKLDQLNRNKKGKANFSDFQFVPIGIMYDEAPEEIKAQNEKAIDLYPYLCLATKSIQELCTKVENLENRVKQLEVKE